MSIFTHCETEKSVICCEQFNNLKLYHYEKNDYL